MGHAIMCYLGDRHDWKLYPRDPRTRARIHQYMNWHHGNTRLISKALFAPVVRPDIPIPKAVIQMNTQQISGIMNAIEQWLTECPWLCGQSPTLADLSCYCEIGQCKDEYTDLFAINGFDFKQWPQVSNWLTRCESLPGYAESHALLRKVSPGIRKKATEMRAKL